VTYLLQKAHQQRTTLPTIYRPFTPCIPNRTVIIPTGAAWVHEIKHDGFRMIIQREGDRVRLLTRNGRDWSNRYPAIVEAALALKPASFVLDGEAVVLDANGLADFNTLMSRKRDAEVKLLAFDLLAVDGVDIWYKQLRERKSRLAWLLMKSRDPVSLASQRRCWPSDVRTRVQARSRGHREQAH
jgi:ATP-dependent DNA ligase